MLLVISEWTSNDYEILTLQHAKLYFFVVHRPPSGNVATFLEILEDFLKVAGENKSRLYLGGDFNIDMLTSSKHQLNLLSLYYAYGLSNVISLPTRIAPLHDRWLDLFLTNVPTQRYLLA